ncbi:MAG: shikimate dehydrogenase [Ruminococcus sp.]|nr:shikimate dehydrogenase [Ruminococcus sp.]
MRTKKYAVIGHPIGHTMSPFIHKRLFGLSGINAEYTALDISPENFSDEYEKTLKNLDGYNVTIPHKRRIIPLLDGLDEKAEMYGSVNTVRNLDGVSRGYTTDPDGFIKALEAADIKIGGRTVILGCGGVARTMAYEIALRGELVCFAVRDKSIEKADALCGEIRAKVCGARAELVPVSDLNGKIDLLINATPVGMYPDCSSQPVSDSVISDCAAVYDAIYNPLDTVLVKKARANGAKAEGGMSMLVWQAVVAHEKWDGSSYDKEDISRLCADCADEMKKR